MKNMYAVFTVYWFLYGKEENTDGELIDWRYDGILYNLSKKRGAK